MSLEGRYVLVRWKDAAKIAGGLSNADIDSSRRVMRSTVGMCLRDDAKGIYVVQSVDGGKDGYENAFSIPREYVKWVKPLVVWDGPL